MSYPRRSHAFFLAWSCLLAVALAAPASAQYFGQSKVQYRTFTFQVLKTEHFDVYFYPAEREGAAISARLAERWYARLSRVFKHDLTTRQPLILYASHADLEQTNIVEGELGEGVGGVTESWKRRIVIPLGGPLADTDHVIGHELVHAFQYDLTTVADTPMHRARLERLPLWFVEGMAEYLSLGPINPNTAMWLRDATSQDKVPPIEDLDDPEYFPYRWGHAFWAYVTGRWGDVVIRPLFTATGATGDVDASLEQVLGVKTKDLSKEWQAAIARTYAPVLESATPAGKTGRLVVTGTGLGGDVNLGPAISPDGRWIAFLSQRSVFSMELYVADAATGEVVRRLTRTASDPHYTSLQFISSAGAWSADSRRLAVAAVVAGRATMAIFDAASGRRERDIAMREVDEVINPVWAPDGHAIAFTGLSQGLTDLYVYDLASTTLRRLTDDAFADVQPAWSPDGRRIAFATDRFSSALDTLSIGSYRLALIDPTSGVVEPVGVFTTGKSINPQWSPDGTALYFLSDRDGVPNVYRVTLATGELAQLTTVGTGVTGITPSSPALSVAQQAGVAAFSVLQNGKYDICTLALAGAGAPLEPVAMNAAILPPADRKSSDVAALLADATLGLPPPQAYPIEGYKPGLSLESVGQPMIAVGVSRFGASFGGGVSMYFRDMLGNRLLATAVQFNSGLTGNFSLKDTAAQAGYFNQAHRWNWGVVAGQMPYLSGGYQSRVGVLQGEPVVVDDLIVYRQTERSASAVAAYPINRAARFEVTSGVSQLSFDRIVRSSAYSLNTGELIQDSTQETSLADTLTLGTSAAAFVSDTSHFGATSPVQGQRYRVEVAPTFGTLNFASVLGDYRRYAMPLPFYTVAARVMHYGRYGGGAEDSRLYPLYLGYPTLVRGYDVNSFDATDCVATATSACPAFDRLVGSRMLVANLELRFPLLRPFGVSRRMYSPVPVELALFADGGVAWNRGERPSFFGGSRDPISSVGVTVRVNLGGVAVGQFDFARPLQRADRGWTFAFNLAPGF